MSSIFSSIYLIIIGDEILNATTKEANSFWLASFLQEKQLFLSGVEIVADDPIQIHRAVKRRWEQDENVLLILSGGLGPTPDDRTKESLASFFKKDLVEVEELKNHLIRRYQELGKKWSEKSNNYHLIPEGFSFVKNRAGLAPALLYQEEKKTLLALPGVPYEFQQILSEEWSSFSLKEDKGLKKRIIIKTRNIPEEEIFFKKCPQLWEELEKFGKVSSLPRPLGVDIVITIDDMKNEQSLLRLLNHGPLAKHIWQIGNLSLEECVVSEAKKKNLTFCFAESCTGGLASHQITNISGASDVFLGSVISYANQAKIDLLQVCAETIKNYGAVSQEVAREMAKGARRSLKTDFAVSFSGIAGPGGGSAEKPVGTVAIAIDGPSGTQSYSYHFRGDRKRLKRRFLTQGLYHLLDAIRVIS